MNRAALDSELLDRVSRTSTTPHNPTQYGICSSWTEHVFFYDFIIDIKDVFLKFKFRMLEVFKLNSLSSVC